MTSDLLDNDVPGFIVRQEEHPITLRDSGVCMFITGIGFGRRVIRIRIELASRVTFGRLVRRLVVHGDVISELSVLGPADFARFAVGKVIVRTVILRQRPAFRGGGGSE